MNSILDKYRFKNLWIIGLLTLNVFLFSCKSSKVAVTPKGKCSVESRGVRWLTSNLQENEFHFNTLDSKLNVDTQIDSTHNSFTVSIRMKKDSIIWMSISKIGIEALRVLITTDSVCFINRMDKQYFKGDFAYISTMLNTQMDFEILQSLLVGNSVSFYDEDEKVKANISNEACEYILGTIRKHKMKKVMVRGKELRDPAQSIYMDPVTFKIKRILFYDFDLNRSFDATFSEFSAVDSTQLFPDHILYKIKAKKNILIKLKYVRHKLNEDVSFSFKIPENYEQIYYKEK